ncbi:MAG: BON domain-containing protein [Isosphaeraceae bacterium]|nr:BON domain-containing protein [Isosphaeraceae bacterium]
MTKHRLGMAPVLVGLALAAWVGVGRAQQQGPAERIGEAIDRTIRELREGARAWGEDIQEQWVKTKAVINRMGVKSRVYGRLHWDKSLTDAPIDLELRKDGVLVLRGTVPDTAAKAKAVTLAKDTVGVTAIEDQLTIAPSAAEPVTTPEATKTTGRRP